MPTLKQLLDHITGKRPIRIQEGACFGVKDRSKLRRESRRGEKAEADDKPKGRTVRIDTDEMMKHLKGE